MDGGKGDAGVAAELLGERTIGWDILLDDGDKAIGVGGDGIHDLAKGTVGVATVILADCGSRVDILEERKGDFVDVEVVASFPLGHSVVKKFSGSESYQIPAQSVSVPGGLI